MVEWVSGEMAGILSLSTADPPALSALFQDEPALWQLSQLCSATSGQGSLFPKTVHLIKLHETSSPNLFWMEEAGWVFHCSQGCRTAESRFLPVRLRSAWVCALVIPLYVARLFNPSLKLICLFVLYSNSCKYFDGINFEDCPSSGKCAGIE